MKARGLDAVCAPVVVERLVRDTVLVTEWVDGSRLDSDASPDVPRLCGVALNAYLTMLLDTGVPHPRSPEIARDRPRSPEIARDGSARASAATGDLGPISGDLARRAALRPAPGQPAAHDGRQALHPRLGHDARGAVEPAVCAP